MNRKFACGILFLFLGVSFGSLSQGEFNGNFSEVNHSFSGQGISFQDHKVFLTQKPTEQGNVFFLNMVSNDGIRGSVMEFERSKDWFPVDLTCYDDRLFLFYNKINRESRASEKGVLIFDPESEEIVDEIGFETDVINEWNGNSSKGATLESFPKAIETFRDPLTCVPFELKYYVSHSTEGKNHLLFRYDYSRENLYVKLVLLDYQLNVLSRKELRIDESRVNVGLFVNNLADIFVLNTDALGLMELVMFDSSLQNFDLLEISPSHAMRDDYILRFQSDYKIFIASKVDYEGELEGVFYAKFNFGIKEIEKINFFHIDDEIKDFADSINHAEFGSKVDWDEFHLVLLESYNEEELLLGIEEIGIESGGKKYYSWQIDSPNDYRPNKSMVFDGMIGLFSFNYYDELRWAYWIPKFGKIDINKLSFPPNFKTGYSGGERIGINFRTMKKGTELERVGFDYFYALEPTLNNFEITSSSQLFIPGLSFFSRQGNWILPYEKRSGNSGFLSIK
jgi:hypothetical protein